MSADFDRDWKLKLRYGKLTTPYAHFTVLADGVVEEASEVNGGREGPAWMSMNAWATSTDEAADMIVQIAPELGFRVTGRIEIYKTDPKEPPRDIPSGYDMRFTPYEA